MQWFGNYIPKAGKSTYGRGRYWSGVAGAAKWGLDICGFAVVDIVNNTAIHLKAWQTPSADMMVLWTFITLTQITFL